MGLLGNLTKQKPETNHEECVLVFVDADPLPDEFWELQSKLYEELDKSDVGKFDGNEIGCGSATLYAYGSDAEKLFQAMKPILNKYALCRKAKVVLRKGPPGSPQTELQL